MAHNQFSLPKVISDFDLTINQIKDLFANIEAIAPSPLLQQVLADSISLATAINTEKARSELIIAPVLLEVWKKTSDRTSLFSGTALDVDQEKGLVSYCDFIISASSYMYGVNAPVVTIVEAKKENLIEGLGQCVASMVAAQIFNNKAGKSIRTIYGAVTSGTVWRFLTLERNIINTDLTEYFINRVDKILGILLHPLFPTNPDEVK